LVFTASSFSQLQQSDLNKINQLRVRKIEILLKYAANSGSRVMCSGKPWRRNVARPDWATNRGQSSASYLKLIWSM